MSAIIQRSYMPKRCLLADSNRVFTDVVSNEIKKRGLNWQIKVVSTGSEAIEFANQFKQSFDLVLLDLTLPDMHGNEVIRTFHSKYPNTPIMVITTLASERNFLEAIQLGASGYLLKNDSILSLDQALTCILDGSYPISPKLAHYLLKIAGSPLFSNPSSAHKLTHKEVKLLKLFAQGLSYEQACHLMGIKLTTVQFHTRNLYKKLEVRTKTQAISKAQTAGILSYLQ